MRSGFLLYGTQPDPDRPVPGLKNPMQLKSQVAQLKEVGPGDVVGYDCTYEVTRPMRIAVVPVGYADGLPFGLSNRGEMLVGGQRAPIVGKVCMDQTMIDVTHIDGVRRGDVVTVFGRDGGQELSVTEMAERAGVFAPGVFCNLNARVTRLFYLGGSWWTARCPCRAGDKKTAGKRGARRLRDAAPPFFEGAPFEAAPWKGAPCFVKRGSPARVCRTQENRAARRDIVPRPEGAASREGVPAARRRRGARPAPFAYAAGRELSFGQEQIKNLGNIRCQGREPVI